ncbi:kinase-like domain-containing protein [Aspergillus karnatakaensis]|uniref:phosphotransferase family protein n=1 Tax=Aspergillus karnatakaensis TaxID=1810916 RepID=UPI003CCCC82A
MSETSILNSTRNTPFPCLSVNEVSGGIANATYRGKLDTTLQDGTDSVIIKHAEKELDKMPELSMSTTRCNTEQSLFCALQNTPICELQHGPVTIKCPDVYHYLNQENTEIIQDLPHDSTLHAWLTNPTIKHNEETLMASGEALGSWLARFHALSKEGIESSLADVVERNSDSSNSDLAAVKLQSVERQCKDEKVRRYVKDILFQRPQNSRVMVHGDFSTRNILFQAPSSSTSDQHNLCSMAIVDWEVCCYDDFTRDVGNVLADLYMQHLFTGLDEPLTVFKSFVSAYSALSEEEVYRTVTHIGENCFHWIAYAPKDPPKEIFDKIVRLGEELVIMGMEGDREGIERTFFGCLFR